MRPASRPAAPTNGLYVEPGAYSPCSAQLLSGKWLAGSWWLFHLLWLMPSTNSAGLNVGNEAITSTPPLAGSRTTVEPTAPTFGAS